MAARGARVAAARRAGVAALAGPFRALARRRWAAAPDGRAAPRALAVARWARSPTTPSRPPCRRPCASAGRRDVQAAQTLSGPHRDDLFIAAGPADLRRAGSQGEQRTAALALLLAARDHLRARAARPILLLDDVLSELDPGRRRLLLEAVRDGGQTLVTTRRPGGRRRPGGAARRPRQGRGRDAAVSRPRAPPPAPAASPHGGRRRAGALPPPRGRGRRRRRRDGRRGAGVGRRGRARGRRPQRAGAPQPRRRAHGRLLERRRGRTSCRRGAPSWPRRLAERCPDAGVSALRFAVADHAVRPAAPPRRPRRLRRPPSGARRSGTPRAAAAAGIAASRRCAIWSPAPPRRRPRAGEPGDVANYLQIRQKCRASAGRGAKLARTIQGGIRSSQRPASRRPPRNYDAGDITVLEGLEAVRRRPGMYIGSTGPRGLHHLVYEVVDNSVDEALAGYCDRVEITLNPDGSCTVVGQRPRHPRRRRWPTRAAAARSRSS